MSLITGDKIPMIRAINYRVSKKLPLNREMKRFLSREVRK